MRPVYKAGHQQVETTSPSWTPTGRDNLHLAEHQQVETIFTWLNTNRWTQSSQGWTPTGRDNHHNFVHQQTETVLTRLEHKQELTFQGIFQANYEKVIQGTIGAQQLS